LPIFLLAKVPQGQRRYRAIVSRGKKDKNNPNKVCALLGNKNDLLLNQVQD